MCHGKRGNFKGTKGNFKGDFKGGKGNSKGGDFKGTKGNFKGDQKGYKGTGKGLKGDEGKRKGRQYPLVCFNCGKNGHKADSCWQAAKVVGEVTAEKDATGEQEEEIDIGGIWFISAVEKESQDEGIVKERKRGVLGRREII